MLITAQVGEGRLRRDLEIVDVIVDGEGSRRQEMLQRHVALAGNGILSHIDRHGDNVRLRAENLRYGNTGTEVKIRRHDIPREVVTVDLHFRIADNSLQ